MTEPYGEAQIGHEAESVCITAPQESQRRNCPICQAPSSFGHLFAAIQTAALRIRSLHLNRRTARLIQPAEAVFAALHGED